VTAFTLIAERFLEPEWSPDAVSERCGVPAVSIRRIAAEIAHTAFEEEISLDVPWTDHLGRYHEKMVGRPVSMHAMRGISAHANGFQTCRTIHLLQILLGTIDVPGGFRYKPPFPKPPPPGVKPAGKPGQVKPNTPLPGPMRKERHSASTRLTVGRRHWRPTASCIWLSPTLQRKIPTASMCCSCTWPT
jgi:anaerobic selenocysteine-containing dehydrogenase